MEMIFQNSLNILWLSISFAVLLLTIFSVWGIYYVIRILKNTNSIIERVTNTIEKVDDILSVIKDKLNSTGAYFAVGIQALQKILELTQGKAKKTSPKSRKK